MTRRGPSPPAHRGLHILSDLLCVSLWVFQAMHSTDIVQQADGYYLGALAVVLRSVSRSAAPGADRLDAKIRDAREVAGIAGQENGSV
jgi:hypothetical protein